MGTENVEHVTEWLEDVFLLGLLQNGFMDDDGRTTGRNTAIGLVGFVIVVVGMLLWGRPDFDTKSDFIGFHSLRFGVGSAIFALGGALAHAAGETWKHVSVGWYIAAGLMALVTALFAFVIN